MQEAELQYEILPAEVSSLIHFSPFGPQEAQFVFQPLSKLGLPVLDFQRGTPDNALVKGH